MQNSEPDVAVLCVLNKANYQDGNAKLKEHGFIRYKHEWDLYDATLVCVPVICLGRLKTFQAYRFGIVWCLQATQLWSF